MYADKFKKCVDFLIEIIFPREFDVFEFEEKVKESFVESQKDNVHFLFKYKNKYVKQSIWEMKFNRDKEVAVFFGKFLAEKIINLDILGEDFLLLPTPIHKKRRNERGFNQCEWLCEEIIKNLKEKLGENYHSEIKIKYEPKILLRDKYTTKQSWSNKDEREQNLKNTFKISDKFRNKIINSKIILIDDVLTTGSTIREMRQTLKESGASKIISIVIAH